MTAFIRGNIQQSQWFFKDQRKTEELNKFKPQGGEKRRKRKSKMGVSRRKRGFTFSVSLWNLQSFVRLWNIGIPVSLGLMSFHFTYPFWHISSTLTVSILFFSFMISKYIPFNLQFLFWTADLHVNLTTDSPTWISHRLLISMSKIYFIILPLAPNPAALHIFTQKMTPLLSLVKWKVMMFAWTSLSITPHVQPARHQITTPLLDYFSDLPTSPKSFLVGHFKGLVV